MGMTRVYEEIIDFLAGGFTPDSLIAYQPSEEAKQRVENLIRREKNEDLSREETSELNHYMELEHILTLAKARARARRSNG
jgi:hypothetical protein